MNIIVRTVASSKPSTNSESVYRSHEISKLQHNQSNHSRLWCNLYPTTHGHCARCSCDCTIQNAKSSCHSCFACLLYCQYITPAIQSISQLITIVIYTVCQASKDEQAYCTTKSKLSSASDTRGPIAVSSAQQISKTAVNACKLRQRICTIIGQN